MAYFRSLHIWRFALLGITIAYWLIPDSWFREARHFGPQLLIVAPVANAVLLAPAAAAIDLVMAMLKFRRKTVGKDAFVVRLVWAALLIINSILLVCFG